MSLYEWRSVDNLFPVSENFPEDFLTEEQVKVETRDSQNIPDTVSALDALQSQDYPSYPQIDDDHHDYPEPLTPDSSPFQHQGLNCLMTSLPPSHVIAPSSDEISGEYNFVLSLETQPKKVANPDWIYSPVQNKLYIKSQTPCPMKFSVTGSPPPHTYVRAMPMFKLPEHAKDVVRCCPNHTQQDQGRENPASGHFIRSDNPYAEYQQCGQSGRMSVKIPFNTNVGASIHEEVTVHELFSFICNNSCGGLNRRAILVVFTLETGESQELLGRCAIEVRVCACPGRDSKQDNEAVSKPSRKKRKMATDSVSSSTSVTSFPTSELNPSQPSRPSVEDNTVYNLKVCGYVNYLILRKIAFALEFFANMKSRFSNMPSDDPEFPDLFADGLNNDQQECDSCDSSEPVPRPIPQASPIINGQQSLPSCAVSRISGDLDSSWYQSTPQDAASSSQSAPLIGCYTTYRRFTLSMVYCENDE